MYLTINCSLCEGYVGSCHPHRLLWTANPVIARVDCSLSHQEWLPKKCLWGHLWLHQGLYSCSQNDTTPRKHLLTACEGYAGFYRIHRWASCGNYWKELPPIATPVNSHSIKTISIPMECWSPVMSEERCTQFFILKRSWKGAGESWMGVHLRSIMVDSSMRHHGGL